MKLGSSREQAESKIILLYIVEKFGGLISSRQIIKIALEHKLMNYFFLQQYLNELCQSSLLTPVGQNSKTSYRITESGRETLAYFTHLLPPDIKERLDSSIQALKKISRSEVRVHADFTPENENEYTVTCSIAEGDFQLLEVKVTVGTKAGAREICDNFKKHSYEIYREIAESLTKKRQEKQG